MSKSVWFFRIPVFIYLLIITTLSSIPAPDLPHVVQLSPDKLLHLMEYFGLGFLLFRWGNTEKSEMKLSRLFILVWILGSAYAGFDEVYQNFIPGRFMDLLDWVSDLTGVILGSLVSYLFISKGWFKKWMV